MSLRACKKCQIVNRKVELYYHELKWQGPPEYLCRECQKQAFHFHVSMLILGYLMHRPKDKNKKTSLEAIKEMVERIAKHAKKNGIREEYWMKLVDRELAKIKQKQDEFDAKKE